MLFGFVAPIDWVPSAVFASCSGRPGAARRGLALTRIFDTRRETLVLITGLNWTFCGRVWVTRSTALCVIAIAVALLLGGCSPTAERSYLVILTEGIPPTLDPLAALDSRVDNPVINLYSALVQYIPGTTDLSLDLAESYDVSDDGRRYVFTLRPDAVFHDGTPVRAVDVKYSIDRMLTLKTGVWAYLTPVSGAEILGHRDVAINLYEPFHGLLGALTRFYVANSKLVRSNEFQGTWVNDGYRATTLGVGRTGWSLFSPNNNSLWSVSSIITVVGGIATLKELYFGLFGKRQPAG